MKYITSPWISLLLAFLANMIPWGNYSLVPDFILPILLFWMMYYPDKVSFTFIFVLGLLMDIQTSSPLGLHAICYVLGGVLMIYWSRRLLTNSPLGQIIVVSQIFLLAHLIKIFLYWLFISSYAFSISYIVFPAVVELCLWPIFKNLFSKQTIFMDRNK